MTVCQHHNVFTFDSMPPMHTCADCGQSLPLTEQDKRDYQDYTGRDYEADKCGTDPWLINDRIKAAAIRWFGPDYERATAGFGAFLCHELGLTHECRYEPLGAGIPTAHRWVTGWEPA